MKLEMRGLSSNTVTAYCKDIRAFFADVDDHVAEDEYDNRSRYWLHANRNRLAPKTTGRHMCSLKAYATAFDISAPALYQYRLPVPLKSDPHPLPEGIEGVYRMIEATDNLQHKCIIALCGLAGLRIAEAINVRASHIDMHGRTMSVRGKGDKVRRLPISDRLWDVICMRYFRSLVENDALMIQIGNRSARRAVSDIGERAGLSRHVASHDLRATFATAVYNKTHNSRIVQELLGHTSLGITEAYLGVNQNQIREAVDL